MHKYLHYSSTHTSMAFGSVTGGNWWKAPAAWGGSHSPVPRARRSCWVETHHSVSSTRARWRATTPTTRRCVSRRSVSTRRVRARERSAILSHRARPPAGRAVESPSRRRGGGRTARRSAYPRRPRVSERAAGRSRRGNRVSRDRRAASAPAVADNYRARGPRPGNHRHAIAWRSHFSSSSPSRAFERPRTTIDLSHPPRRARESSASPSIPHT